MEEAVGIRWHHFITRVAVRTYPDAAVLLSDEQKTLAMIFRALGGDAGLRLSVAAEQRVKASRSWLQKVAGSGLRQALAWRDQNHLYLPDHIDFYPQRTLNADLYLWLAALASCTLPAAAGSAPWFVDNQHSVQHCLQRYPGLVPVYRRLVEAELQQRDFRLKLSAAALPREMALRAALKEPGSVTALPDGPGDPDPVPLWLYPGRNLAPLQHSGDVQEPAASEVQQKSTANIRRQAEFADDPDGRNGLLLFRLESLLSWSEFIPVDRTADDADDADAGKIAEDLDLITLSRTRGSQASKIRLDLDLPSAAEDDIPLGSGLSYPEWDYRQQRLREDYCRVIPMLPRGAGPAPLPDELKQTAQRLRRQFACFNTQPVQLRRQVQGQQLDINAAIDHCTSRLQGHAESVAPVWRQQRRQNRDLACLVLADLSLSTDAWANNDKQVIDVIRDSLHLLGEALNASGDRFSMYGFSSRRRDHVRINMIKNFNEPWGENVHGRIKALTPGYYTRMGAAIRQATHILNDHPAEKRLLLILTDGKPNDLDLYEGRYGLEDTRVSITEAHRAGVTTHCVTIDHNSADYVPYVFGHQGYFCINRADQLPRILPKLYLNLTGLNI